jgi:energy-coupling factor transport system ATP-binding protein
MPFINLRNITYNYPHNVAETPHALSGVNLTIEPGQYIALVGANGSGKSTLARLLNGLILPTEGEVTVEGLSTSEQANLDRIRETVGMVFQNPESQIVATSVADDIAFGLENLGLPQDEIESRVQAAAARFGLTELLAREPHWLSGGQKQRTVLAGVTALQPRVLVLDEPTTMLDPRSRRELMLLIEELWRSGVTIIHATQFMEEAARAGRLIALAAGRIAFDGAPGDFFTDAILLEKTSLEPPLAVRLRTHLAGRGINLPVTLTPEQLVDAVCACR